MSGFFIETKILKHMDENIERFVQRTVAKSLLIINEERMQKFASKHQVTKSEIIEAYDLATFNDLTKRLGLQPVRQNGKNGKIYYSTKKVLDILSKWYH
jgi:hypothetical protein